MTAMNTLVAFFKQFVDNAHLGKVVTDMAPGMLGALAIVLFCSSYVDVDFLPYFQSKLLKKQSDEVAKELESQRLKLSAARLEKLELEKSKEPPSAKLLAKAELKVTEAVESLAEQRKLADAALARYTESRTLAANVDAISKNLIISAFFGLILGAVMAQISGGLFYNGLFYAYFRRKFPKIEKFLYPSHYRSSTYYQALLKFKDADAGTGLSSDYFRYLEIAMNMILPFGMMSFAFCAKAFTKVGESGAPELGLERALMTASIVTIIAAAFTSCVRYNDKQLWVGMGILGLALYLVAAFSAKQDIPRMYLQLSFASLLVCVALFHNARELYVGYMLKKADHLAAIKQELANQSIATGPIDYDGGGT